MSTEVKVGIAAAVVVWIFFVFLIYCALRKGGMEDDMAGRPRG